MTAWGLINLRYVSVEFASVLKFSLIGVFFFFLDEKPAFVDQAVKGGWYLQRYTGSVPITAASEGGLRRGEVHRLPQPIPGMSELWGTV